MLKTFINRLTISLALFGALLMPLAPATVSAQTKADICRGVGITGGNPDDPNCTAPAGSPTVEGIIRTVINLLSIIVGVVAVIMIIIGGLKYITSSGDSSNIQSAKNTILYAIIGLVVVALAQVIVRFVLDKAA